MYDEDRTKRLFHCVFTDCPGTKEGALGSITPELLSTFFSSTNHRSNNGSSSEARKGKEVATEGH
jgi:hypothetical protein